MKPLEQIIETRRRLGEDLDEVAYDCAECRNTGWRVNPDGGAGAAERCPCQLKRGQAENRQALVSAGMKRTEIKSAFTPWDESHQPTPVFAREWLTWVLRGARRDEVPDSVLQDGAVPVEPWILTLFGEPGRGKTKTAAILARGFSQEGGRCLVWANSTDAFDRVQEERFSSGFSEYEKGLKAAGVLVIDDFGRTHRKGETLESTVNNWLYHRHRDELPTVLSTNYLKFEQITNPAIASRIAAGVYKTMSAATDFRDCGRLELVQKGDSKWQESR